MTYSPFPHVLWKNIGKKPIRGKYTMAQAGLLKVKQPQKGAYEMQWKLKKTKRIILLNAYWFNYVEPDKNTFGFNCVQSVHHDLQALDTHFLFPFWPIHSVNKYLVQSIWLDTSTKSNSVLGCLIVMIQLVWTFSSFKLGGTIWHSFDTWLKLLLWKVEQVSLVSLEEQFVWKLQSSPVLYFFMFCQKTLNVLLRCFGAVSLLLSLY